MLHWKSLGTDNTLLVKKTTQLSPIILIFPYFSCISCFLFEPLAVVFLTLQLKIGVFEGDPEPSWVDLSAYEVDLTQASVYSLYASETDLVEEMKSSQSSLCVSFIGLFITWILATVCLLTVWMLAPPLESGYLSFPKDLEHLRILAETLENYKEHHLSYTILLFGLAYVYKQSFAIPGSFFMNLLAGALFGVYLGSVVVCTLNAVGSSGCFLLSAIFARPLAERCLKKRIIQLNNKIAPQRHRLFIFLLSARVFPFSPHWLLNIASPFLDVPLYTHFFTVLIGLIPYNVICVRAGMVLAEIRSFWDVIDLTIIAELLALAVILLIAARIARRNRPEDDVLPQRRAHASTD